MKQHATTIWHTIALLDIYSRKTDLCLQKKPVHKCLLQFIHNKQKLETTQMLVTAGDCSEKRRTLHQGHALLMKRTGFLTGATTQGNLQRLMLSENSQSQKATRRGIHLQNILETTKVEARLVIDSERLRRGWGWEEVGVANTASWPCPDWTYANVLAKALLCSSVKCPLGGNDAKGTWTPEETYVSIISYRCIWSYDDLKRKHVTQHGHLW